MRNSAIWLILGGFSSGFYVFGDISTKIGWVITVALLLYMCHNINYRQALINGFFWAGGGHYLGVEIARLFGGYPIQYLFTQFFGNLLTDWIWPAGVVFCLLAILSAWLAPMILINNSSAHPSVDKEKMNHATNWLRKRGQELIAGTTMCPYCLGSCYIIPQKKELVVEYKCPECGSMLPSEYVTRKDIRREVINAVGFRGHGKTCFFASQFLILDELANIWPGFYTHPMTEESLIAVKDNIKSLTSGLLPTATPATFPTPTLVQFGNMPIVGDRYYIFYDVGGEAYRSASTMTSVKFLSRASTVCFLVSVDLIIDSAPREMHELLSVYVQGLTKLGGSPQYQNLLVVFTMGDRINNRALHENLENGSLDQLRKVSFGSYVLHMKEFSKQLKTYLTGEVGATQFVNFAQSRFKSFECCLVSALGYEPSGNKLQLNVTPKHVIDPLLWTLYNSMSDTERQDLWGKI